MLAPMWARRPVTTLLVDGQLEASGRDASCRRMSRLHPKSSVGYIDWATYEENRRVMQRNSVNREGDEMSMAAIRAGQGLLVGLIRCGHCGRKSILRYWGGSGHKTRDIRKGDYDDGGIVLYRFWWQRGRPQGGTELSKAIGPLGIEASLRAVEELNASAAIAQRAALSRKLEQLEYEARKAFEQA